MSSRKPKLDAVVLAAGQSKRFRGTRPKVLHPLAGRPIVGHVLDTLREVHRSEKLGTVAIVVPPGRQVENALKNEKLPFKVVFATQTKPLGTGDAARVGLKKVDAQDVLVVAGDMPLVRAESLVSLVRARRDAEAAGALLTAITRNPPPYGRIVRNETWITGIVEARDASPEELAITEVNLCTYVFNRDALVQALPKVKSDNAQGERYLTDVAAIMVEDGQHLTSVQGEIEEVYGTNTRGDFATVARIMRERIVADLMDAGVTVIDPDTTYVDAGVRVGPDTVLRPNTFLEGATKIGSNAEIGPNTRLVDTTVGDDTTVSFTVAVEAKIGPQATVGPFASLRPGTVLAKGAKAGTFAEMKNAKIGEGSKVPHFSYLGDVTVGRDSNIGAGTITSNYDGKDKHQTHIGDETFVGSDSILVAPVRVGSRAYTGAGSVVTRNVPPGGLVYGVPATPQKRKPRKKKPSVKKKGKKR
jgi:bifunctional UDP-N-acetylglucosamine pyrophosphorylase / glucosamine-1-phosphate N-acetyltransferase